ncbi:MAG: lipid-A-disaccharide synthase [Candidatus Sumerlaeaceae bacterium]|nr:lipid-A-disaccharide synthase [Candidatus Sumerlaeaceae bacterium]
MADAAPRLLFVAGENSGDQHAARLIRHLLELEPQAQCFGFGGVAMERAGMRLDENLAQKMPVIGLSQALRHYNRLKALLARAEATLDTERPDAVVLVDYPGFNLRLAQAAARRGIPVIYYISPQIWAWHKSRLAIIAKSVRLMLVILPFEERIYRQAGVPVTYVGHPLADHNEPLRPAAEVRTMLGIAPEAKVIGILPGSREPEIVRHLEAMLGAARLIARRIPESVFVLPRAETVSRPLIDKYCARFPDVPLRLAETDHRSVRAAMQFALCKSGTSTLELALLGVPMVIIYRVSWLTELMARAVLRIPWIGLVNIVANEEVAPELLQRRATPAGIAQAALEILENPAALARQKEKLGRVAAAVGGPGASRRAAEAVLSVVRGIA